MSGPVDALSGLENERLFNGIEAALALLHTRETPEARLECVRECFPSPAFFMEASEYVKQKAGMSRMDALYFSMIPQLARYVAEEHFGDRPVLNRLSLMAEYLVRLYQGIHRERFYAVMLDGIGRKISTVLISKGNANSALFDLKLLLSSVVREEARAVVLCHNHPRGTLRPSEEDARCTLRALKALKVLGVPLLDHIIIAYDRAVSIRDTGVIPAGLWPMQAPKSKLLRDWIDVDLLAGE